MCTFKSIGLIGILSLISGACAPASSEDLIIDACLAPEAVDIDYPAAPYGAQIGDQLGVQSLDDCSGDAYSFEQAFAQAELTLVNVGAGWCRPCRDETAELEERVHLEFCSRGLRVVQILYQDQNVAPATPTFCEQWTEEFGLSFPVLTDPFFSREVWFDDAQSQTPLNLLVSREGIVLERMVGDSGIEALVEAIERHLPAQSD